MIEITVKIRGEDQILSEKFLVHEEGLSLSRKDYMLSQMVDTTKEKFKGVVEDILVKIKYQWM